MPGVAKPANSAKAAKAAKGRSKAARLGGPSSSIKKRKVVRFEPSPSRCATNGNDSDSDVESQETANAYEYADSVVREAFALAARQKKWKHKGAHCISDEHDECVSQRYAHKGHIDYGDDLQAFQDDEE